MSEDEQGQTQGKLVTQLGSDARHLSRGINDMSLLSIIGGRQVLPLTYFIVSGIDDEGDKVLSDTLLKLYVSKGGRGRRDLIQGEGVMKGAQPNTEAEIERPNIIARHTYARDKEAEWKRQQGLE